MAERDAAVPTAAAVLQQEAANSSSPPPPASGGGGKSSLGLPLLAGLPVLLVIVTAVVVLLLVLVWLNYRSKRNAAKEYQKVSTHDSMGPVMNLPYPAASKAKKIKMMDPPVPGTTTQYVEATRLGSYSGSSRYPFTDTDQSTRSTSSSDKERSRKPPRRKSRQPLEVKFRSSDRSSGSEEGFPSPKVPSSPASRSAAVTPPPSPTPSHQSYASEEDSRKRPEVYLSLSYHENEAMLGVKIERAVSLPCRPDGTPVDPYVRLFFIPKLPELPQRRTSKTKMQKRESSPVFDELVEYEAMSMEEIINSNLHVEVLDYRSYGKHVVLGQADIPLIQVQFVRGEAAITLPLKSPKVREDLGTVLVSICYSPDTKKLGVIVLRAKDLNKGNSRETDAQAKIWITLGGDRTLGRMRTKKKAQSCSPIFNEALTCTVEPSQVKSAAVNIAIINDNRSASKRELGQVTLCSQCAGEEFRHWNDVMATPGKHIAEWHELR